MAGSLRYIQSVCLGIGLFCRGLREWGGVGDWKLWVDGDETGMVGLS